MTKAYGNYFPYHKFKKTLAKITNQLTTLVQSLDSFFILLNGIRLQLEGQGTPDLVLPCHQFPRPHSFCIHAYL